jgi:hypothetical protein
MGRRVHWIYGDGNATEITDGKKGGYYFFLTEGLGVEQQDALLSIVPPSLKVRGGKLSELGIKPDESYYVFIILPDAEKWITELPDKKERTKMPVPRVRFYSSDYGGRNYIYPTNQTEAQATIRMLDQLWNWKLSIDAKTIKYNWEKGIPGAFMSSPDVKSVHQPSEKGFRFRFSDIFSHPFRSIAAFFTGVGYIIYLQN